jgi:hypothetical protein
MSDLGLRRSLVEVGTSAPAYNRRLFYVMVPISWQVVLTTRTLAALIRRDLEVIS